MRYILAVLGVLLLVTLSSAQNQRQQLPNSPPYSTPSTFPSNSQQSPQEMPPDQNAPPMSTAEVKEQIQARLISDPALSNTTVDVMADETSVALVGSVDTEKQRTIAIRIARAYAGDRKVIDKIGVRQQK